MTARDKMTIKKAFDSMTGDYIYICDLLEASGLPEADFQSAFSKLVQSGNMELETGEWADGKTPYLLDGEEFFGVKWVKDPPSAFERLWAYRSEIVEVRESGSKEDAARRGSELTGIGQSTVSPYITHFPFLCAEFTKMENEADALKERIRQLEKAHQATLKELDRRTDELNREQKKKGADGMTQKDFEARLVALEKALLKPETKPEPAKPKQKVGAWSVTMQGVYYKLTRNFGKRDDGKKDVKNLHLGKEFSEPAAREKIQQAGFTVD